MLGAAGDVDEGCPGQADRRADFGCDECGASMRSLWATLRPQCFRVGRRRWGPCRDDAGYSPRPRRNGSTAWRTVTVAWLVSEVDDGGGRVDCGRRARRLGDRRPGRSSRPDAANPFERSARIGVDEISYRHGNRDLMVVVNDPSDRWVRAANGHDHAIPHTFLDLIGAEARLGSS